MVVNWSCLSGDPFDTVAFVRMGWCILLKRKVRFWEISLLIPIPPSFV